jgi:hypothetical protein
MSDRIFIFKNPNDFFNNLIDEAVRLQELKLTDPVRFYLLSLLSGNLENIQTPYQDTPLAILLHQAVLSPIDEKRNILKFVGDNSLYTAGYFNQSLNKKTINRNYYIGIGEIAFKSLSGVASTKTMEELYWELFKSFNDMVKILTEISAKTFSSTSEDIIRLYEIWQNTQSKVIENILLEKGVITKADKKKH